MNSKMRKSFISGIAGTIVMTAFMFIGPFIGMPKMNPAEMLADMMGIPILAGWVLHFLTGIIFSASYVYLFNPKVRIGNETLKGAVFGLSVFVFAQIAMGIMGSIMGGMPEPEGSMVLLMIGSIIGHIVFGIVVALFVKGKE